MPLWTSRDSCEELGRVVFFNLPNDALLKTMIAMPGLAQLEILLQSSPPSAEAPVSPQTGLFSGSLLQAELLAVDETHGFRASTQQILRFDSSLWGWPTGSTQCSCMVWLQRAEVFVACLSFTFSEEKSQGMCDRIRTDGVDTLDKM